MQSIKYLRGERLIHCKFLNIKNKKYLNKWKTLPCPSLEELILLRWQYSQSILKSHCYIYKIPLVLLQKWKTYTSIPYATAEKGLKFSE
jgi:hypothetical protein